MPANQTDRVSRSNISHDLSDVQSMFMITTQLFADCKRDVKCQLTYLMFCIASKLLSARGLKSSPGLFGSLYNI